MSVEKKGMPIAMRSRRAETTERAMAAPVVAVLVGRDGQSVCPLSETLQGFMF